MLADFVFLQQDEKQVKDRAQKNVLRDGVDEIFKKNFNKN